MFDGPENATHSFIFAHGAGAGMEHEFMCSISQQLAQKNIRVLRFEFPYMQKRREQGTKTPPNRQPQLVASYKDVVEQAQLPGKLVIGGKSMGGRIASLLIHEEASLAQNISGLICLGFPFYAPKKTREASLSLGENLHHTSTQTLILQGERDHFGKREELQAMPFTEAVEVAFLADGDHSFKPRVKSGYTLPQNMDKTVELMAEFILSL